MRRATLIIPILVAGALFALAFKLGNPALVLGRIEAIPLSVLALSLAMGAAYLALKGLQLRLLLADIGMRPSWPRFVLAYAFGEVLVTLPLGIFAQNWILSSTGHSDFGKSAAATVVMLAAESFVVFMLIAVVGVPHWLVLRVLAAVFAAGVLVTGAIVVHFEPLEPLIGRWAQRARWHWLGQALDQFVQLLEGVKELSSWRMFGFTVVLAGAYLAALAFAFKAVGVAVGLHQLSYVTAATIYAVSLAGVLLFGGLVSHFGTLDVLGMGAAQAWGIRFDDGLVLMLGFRLVWTGVIWLFGLPPVLLLWRKVLRARGSTHDREKTRH